jgi:diacylglycerol kinase family enzyme
MTDVLLIHNARPGAPWDRTAAFIDALVRSGASVTIRGVHERDEFASVLHGADAFDRVVTAGGDGTVSTVAGALADSGIPILPLPVGTANLLAMNLSLPSDPQDLAHICLDGHTRRFDLGSIDYGDNGASCVPFAIMAGVGFAASLIDTATELKPALGDAAYYISSLQHLVPGKADFVLEMDGGRSVTTSGIAVVIVNLARIQMSMRLTTKGEPDDGRFEVVVLGVGTAFELLPALGAALFDMPERPNLEVHHASTVTVHAIPALPVTYDGEMLAAPTPFTARVLPGAATFVVPV